MMPPPPQMPDSSLRALRQGSFPAEWRARLVREGAVAFARYLRNGGSLLEIDEERSGFHQGRLVLFPPPTGQRWECGVRSAEWGRAQVEADLLSLRDSWSFAISTPWLQLRFLLGFCRELSQTLPVWRTWTRQWVKALERDRQAESAELLHTLLNTASGKGLRNGVVGVLRGHVAVDPEGLLSAVRAFSGESPDRMNQSPRAQVFAGTLLGEEVILKSFAPNPRPWRRRFETSRARQSWAGSMLLHQSGQPCPEPLGFVERLENGRVCESHVIHRKLPEVTPFRVWLITRLPRMSLHERRQCRHALRERLFGLDRLGIYHRDTKLLNLLVREEADGLHWWWIDLEDIRAASPPPFWNWIRNFYQINSSIPKRVTREERLAFAGGFSTRHPLATHPLVIRLVESKTRTRLIREVEPFSPT